MNIRVDRSRVKETTALGAAYMAGLKVCVYKSLNDISKNWRINKRFSPNIDKIERLKLLKGWAQAITKTLI